MNYWVEVPNGSVQVARVIAVNISVNELNSNGRVRPEADGRYRSRQKEIMMHFQVFPIDGAALLDPLRSVGLHGISCNRKDYGTHVSISTVWLCLADGTVLRLQPDMHDLEGWDEIGSLEIDKVDLSEVVQPLVTLSSQWQHVTFIEKLVISEPDYFSSEPGLKITNREKETIIICNGAAPYELALSTPAVHEVFNPEYPLERYILCKVFPQ